jgi:cell wall-associated NlpC family hydrolase
MLGGGPIGRTASSLLRRLRTRPAPGQPGDLVFSGQSPTTVAHVGLVATPGIMVDASDSGADFGRELYLGDTRSGSTLSP